MGGRAIRRVVTLLASAAMLATVVSCSLLPGSNTASQPQPERTTLRIGVLPMVDVAPLFIAQRDKLFEAAGLQVDLLMQPNEQEALKQLAAGNIDVAFATYVTLFKAAASGTALQLQGEAYQAASNTMALVTKPGSSYANPADKATPRIAVNSADDVGVLTTKSVLQVAGVAPDGIKFQNLPYADMANALQTSKDVDAAWMPEPFITKAQKQFGAQILTDVARGATLEFPISGYASSRSFADANRRTLAAFRKTLTTAQQRAANPQTVHSVLSSYADVDGATAELVSIGAYPVSLNAVRLQRVADMMEAPAAKMLASRLDVAQMIPQESAT